VIGLPSLLGDIACGVRRFSCGKNERMGVTRSAERYTSSGALCAPPSPQGEGFFIADNRKGFPLRGSSAEGGDEV